MHEFKSNCCVFRLSPLVCGINLSGTNELQLVSEKHSSFLNPHQKLSQMFNEVPINQHGKKAILYYLH